MQIISQLDNYLTESKNHISDYGIRHLYNLRPPFIHTKKGKMLHTLAKF